MMRARFTRWIWEGAIVVLLVVTAFWYGRFAFLNTSAPPDYFWMSPAVTIATGQTFGKLQPKKDSPAYEFMTSRRAAISVQDAKAADIGAADQFDFSVRYLYLAVGYWWKVVGISWAGVADVAALLHVIAIIGAYATLRLFTPVLLSAAGALWMSTASLQLMFVPHIRDYSKGAFILAGIPLIIVLAIRARSQRLMLAAATGLGLVIGIGMGFRRDITVLVPIAVACIVLFRGSRPWTGLWDKTQAIAVLLVTLVVSAYPVLSKFSTEGSNSYHVILLGYADQFDKALEIKPSVYRVAPYYDDGYVANMLAVRGELSGGRWPPYASLEYDRAGRELWIGILRHFPADEVTRIISACNAVLNLLFENPATAGMTHPVPGEALWTRAYAWLHQWDGWGFMLGLLLIAAAAISAPRAGALAALLILSLGGYPSLQFGGRHYFHLQFVPVFAVIVVLWALAVSFMWFRRNGWRRPSLNLVLVAVPLALAIALPLLVLREYQARHVDHLIASFLDGPRTRLEPERVNRPDAKVLLRWPDAPGRQSRLGPLAWSYYVVDMEAGGPTEIPAVGLRFRSTSGATECQRVLFVPPTNGVVRFGVETYSYPGHQFEGFEVEERAATRVKGIYRMAEDGPDRIPLELRLAPGWERTPLYQRLWFEGTGGDPNLEYKANIPFRTCS